MDKIYEELLTRSIIATETTANALRILSETSKTMNDNLISHNSTMKDIYRLGCEGNEISRQNNKLLLTYLKWAIVTVVVILGGAKVFAEAKVIISHYVL
jgi:hypothetical protein